MTTEAISVRIPASVDAARRARSVIASVLHDDPRADDIKLATSELISNAVKHANLSEQEPIRLEIRNTDERQVRVVVSHRGTPISKPHDPLINEGYGFRIVEAISTRWDVGHDAGTTTAWFEI